MKLLLFLLVITSSAVHAQSKKEKLEISTSAVCGMCEDTIEEHFMFEKGVRFADLKLKENVLYIEYNPKKTNPTTLRKALTNIGYDADKLPANEEAYENLALCCKKGSKCAH